ncbi:MAG: hypothetical protein Ct9H300mP11_31310 [Chloroflexota bacterium]|nr:MAG: hypothetical protein Ct9H300mP11_31310 [Chloroflexota bacterium]
MVRNHRGDKDSMIVCLRDSSLHPRQPADNGVLVLSACFFLVMAVSLMMGAPCGRSIR